MPCDFANTLEQKMESVAVEINHLSTGRIVFASEEQAYKSLLLTEEQYTYVLALCLLYMSKNKIFHLYKRGKSHLSVGTITNCKIVVCE